MVRPIPYPLPIRDAAVVAQGGRLYSFGGASTGGAVQAAYRYDPTTDHWTAIQPLREPLEALSAVSDGTAIYLLNGAFSHHVYRYDPALDTYSVLADAPQGTTAQAMGYLNGTLYRMGGQLPGTGATTSVDAYNISTNTWSSATPYPQPAYLLMTAALNGNLYTAGGAGPEDLANTYRYNPAGGGWEDSPVPDLPAVRWGPPLACSMASGYWPAATATGRWSPPP